MAGVVAGMVTSVATSGGTVVGTAPGVWRGSWGERLLGGSGRLPSCEIKVRMPQGTEYTADMRN
jgi:hypothetical protein